jgi:hypothetical protein
VADNSALARGCLGESHRQLSVLGNVTNVYATPVDFKGSLTEGIANAPFPKASGPEWRILHRQNIFRSRYLAAQEWVAHGEPIKIAKISGCLRHAEPDNSKSTCAANYFTRCAPLVRRGREG